MKLQEIIKHSVSSIFILGVIPVHDELASGAPFVLDLLTLNKQLRVTILCESDTELFHQSLLALTANPKADISFTILRAYRDRILGGEGGGGLKPLVSELASEREQKLDLDDRLEIAQTNLRLPYNIIVADERVFVAIRGCDPCSANYDECAPDSSLRADALSLTEVLSKSKRGREFLSHPNTEMLQMYDNEEIPRGIFPRSCFYTEDYQRHSVWGFIFNRKGEFLLHQRSSHTKDGRELWDKSTGGHVDLTDSSTYITAQRELVEELFLPEAEHTKYMKADIGDIINFGDWNLNKRLEDTFTKAFRGLRSADWIMFRATGVKGAPLTVKRKSRRRLHVTDNDVRIRSTRFISDVYLFIAPEGFLDTDEQMKSLFQRSLETGAALNHKLLTLAQLSQWISEKEQLGEAESTFTDDLLYINSEHRALLERFSEFIKYTCKT